MSEEFKNYLGLIGVINLLSYPEFEFINESYHIIKTKEKLEIFEL